MKAAILDSIEHLMVTDVPEPQLEAGAIIIRVKLCSICATDIRIYRYGDPQINLPQVLGHEIAGEVLKVSDLMTHTFPLASIEEAFRFAESRQGMHVAISP